MSEQTPTPETDTADDLEAHRFRGINPGDDATDDVEGHMPLRRGIVEDDVTDDVEGHMPFRRIVGDEGEGQAAKDKD